MKQQVRRIYTEKRPGFNIEAQHLLADLRSHLGLTGLSAVRVVNRYDVAGLDEQSYQLSLTTVFAEPSVDVLYQEELPYKASDRVFAMEYLPGQYDQRADSAAQCLQILTQQERPMLLSAKVVVLSGVIADAELATVKAYCINPVESREASMEKPETLATEVAAPPDVAVLTGFIAQSDEMLHETHQALGLAMSEDDLRFCQVYFRETEKRDPTITEIRVIDTYWSDHCRHTTFFTEINDVSLDEGKYTQPVQDAYQEYLAARDSVYGQTNRPVSLMDIAVIAMKELKRAGKLDDLDESDEINACSIVTSVEVDYGQGPQTEPWLVMFKNETHNHPTEIEPFGGAATCLGGAIRDPLSGRSYVYQAMRVSGSGDPRTPMDQTLPGKLPQRKITLGAWAGYSSYGNQIGLATGQVAEIYDEGFVAKRMEVGAVIGAAPQAHVRRDKPEAGDAVLLIGGRTGRDGCGGATGSSKEHTEESLETCGAEVQKGNPVTERKIQRLFRNPAVSTMIKKSNDFGAGGVSVAIGELADGLEIQLDEIPKKYKGLDGTELAISESQERMAVVVAASDVAGFVEYAKQENLEATQVASVTGSRRLIMRWRGQAIVDISRDFLDTSGVQQSAQVTVAQPNPAASYFTASVESAAEKSWQDTWLETLSDLNVCSQRGMTERFDSTIGSGTVLLPLSGRCQDTPAEGMAAKIPVLGGETTTATLMSYGYNPRIAKWSPFHGALFAVVEAVAKIAAMGGDYRRIRMSLQEYFEKLGTNRVSWGKPFSALLGAYYAQKRLEIPAIGGKDSMSGSFQDINVPPTLIAFAVTVADASRLISPDFKVAGSQVVLLSVPRNEDEIPDFQILIRNLAMTHELIGRGLVRAAQTIRIGGIAAAVSKMCFGNRIGLAFTQQMDNASLFAPDYGSILLELPETADLPGLFGDVEYSVIGRTTALPAISIHSEALPLEVAFASWSKPLADVFPIQTEPTPGQAKLAKPVSSSGVRPMLKVAKPRILIPVFPGTNCEDDSAQAFTKAGGLVETLIIRNLTPQDVEQSVTRMVEAIERSQIIMLPGGFSAGDEPEGSGKFIAVMFRNPRITEAVRALLQQRDGLMLGICNGFQALIKLGLVPYGDIVDPRPDMPTLTYNTIGRHVSRVVSTRVVSTLSPWLSNTNLGDIHSIAVSHGEGRFVATEAELDSLMISGQVATQYVDFDGNPSHDSLFNPNGSLWAVEAITSPDGRVLGKMGHSERVGRFIGANVPGEKDQKLFAAGVKYYS
ncbi:phosphoribosylformylglycinamidine synthase [Anaerosporomusa subterranea]|uniref:Phosphoribosylformylglycinamidine synthase n=1 Tax=Anaerosporomusa subterranea TaxID=1794912 RepID=A0A154BW95_ANASB|nr:phosphoribosylformylglycinamidine synthase [Anaerosporomusa subterranea]KYZ78216.1 phosphoribosylformylglycinamidine synthase [Anaerosporomusa subterranea]